MRRGAERELRRMVGKPAPPGRYSARAVNRRWTRRLKVAYFLLVSRDLLALKPKRRTDKAMEKIEDGWREAGAQKLWQAALLELGA